MIFTRLITIPALTYLNRILDHQRLSGFLLLIKANFITQLKWAIEIFRLEVGLCKLVLAVFETAEFVAAEDSKLHDLEAGKINISCVQKTFIGNRCH